MSLILRIPKGSALTNAELDGNFTYLDERSNTLVNALVALTEQNPEDITKIDPDIGISIPDLNDTLRGLINEKQNLNVNLSALSGLTTNGIVVQTGSGSITTRSLQSSSGIIIQNNNGVDGNISLALDTGVVVTLNTNQILTNKTINGNQNTIRNIDIGRDTIGLTPINRGGTGASTAANARVSLNVLINPTGEGFVVKSSSDNSVTRIIQVSGVGLSINNASGTGGNPTITLSSSSDVAPNNLVARDSTGSFKANTVTANLNGTANQANRLTTARRINGVLFDGTADITVVDNSKLPITGGALSNFLTLHASPVNQMHAATKEYVDVSLSTYSPNDSTKLPLAGGSMSGYITLHAQPASSMHAATKGYVDTVAASVPGNPTGTVITFAGSSPPAGYLECNGQAVSKSTYAALFAVIGATYGPSNETTFTLPDLRGEFVRGWDHGRGIDSGRTLGSWQKGSIVAFDESFDHIWTASTPLNGLSSPIAFGLDVGFNKSLYPDVRLVGNSDVSRITDLSNNNSSQGWYGVTRPRNVSMMYCIKF